jgi:sRNA-binding regulator protein Hfq
MMAFSDNSDNRVIIFFSAFLFIMAAAEGVPAAQIKLNNGTVLNGEIVSQNENSIVVQVGQARLSIAKSMVTEISGSAGGTAVTGAASAQQPAAEGVPGVTSGKPVEITLTNGSKFKGSIVAMDDRIIGLEVAGGSRLDFYKINIADVRDLSLPSPAVAPVAAPPAQQPAPATPSAQTPVPAPVQAEAAPGKNIEITLKNGTKFKGMVTAADDRLITLEVARGSRLDFYRSIIVDIRDQSQASSAAGPSPVPPAQVSTSPQVQPVPSMPPAQKPPAPVQPQPTASVQPSAPVQPLAASGASVPVVTGTAEAAPGKNVELTLKNGSKFKGTVIAADDRLITLEVARGSNLDFYKDIVVGVKDLSLPSVTNGQVPAAPLPQPGPAAVITASAPIVAAQAPVPAAPAPVASQVQETKQPVAVVTPPAPQPAPAAVSTPAKKMTPAVTPVAAPLPVAAVTPMAPAPAPPAPPQPPIMQPPAPQPPAQPAVVAMQQKRQGGKNELKLKNGTVLSGVIVSSNDWFIVFSTGGVTVNVLRRLIASVDGAANADTVMPVRGTPAAAAPEKVETITRLVKAISDSSGEARKRAIAALGAMGDTIAVLPLIAALQNSDPAVRKAAAEALGDIRDPRAILPLYSALQDPVDSARAAVQFSLVLHSEIPLLIGALDNRNTLVRDNAAYILWLLTGKNFGNDKQGWVNWYSERREAK